MKIHDFSLILQVYLENLVRISVVKVRVEKRDIKHYGEMTVINDGRR